MKKSNSKVFMMCGIPGSGKSTFVEKRLSDYKVCRISRDEIRFSLLKDGEDYFLKEKQVFNKFIKAINSALARGEKNIVVDATHLTNTSRKAVLRQFKYVPKEIHAIYLDCPLDVAIERNSYRVGRAFVPVAAIKNMYSIFKKPTLKEGFSSILTVNEESQIKEVEM